MDPDSDNGFVEEMLQSMDWNAQIGQMAQIDVNMLLNDDKTALRQDLLDHYIGTLGVGSVLNNVVDPTMPWSIRDFREAVIQIQATAQKFERPPVIWGLDSVHGANYLTNTIITPQPLNLAASFNISLSYQAGKWASRDTRRAGIPWLFSPLLGLSWNPLWSRIYETFGEDPVVVGSMAHAMTQGIQVPDDNTDSMHIIPSRAAACAKHWVGYSMPHNGHDRAPSWIPTRHLYQYFLLPWKQVLHETLTVMESYTEIDGVPNVANRRTLQRLLRHELGFQGMLVTDYHEIFNLAEWHHTAKDRTEALQQVLVEGTVDMSMIANEPDDFFAAMHNINITIPKSRIQTSARRVLQLKHRLRMFQESFNMTNDEDNHGPSSEDLQAALEMTHQSIVLAKNKANALPLDPQQPLQVLVTGPTSHSLSFQTGGWTGQWQGVDANKEDEWFTYGSTVWDAMQQRASSSDDHHYNWQVTYECGVDILGRDCQDQNQDQAIEENNDEESNNLDALQEQQSGGGGVMGTIKGWVGWSDQDANDGEIILSMERTMNRATNSDVIVVCLGEENYAEKPGDIRSLLLPSGQYELVAGLRQAAPEAKIVLMYFGGRPRLLAEIVVRNNETENNE
jgi:beta-glucosidase